MARKRKSDRVGRRSFRVEEKGSISEIYRGDAFIGKVLPSGRRWAYENCIGTAGTAETRFEAFAMLGFKLLAV